MAFVPPYLPHNVECDSPLRDQSGDRAGDACCPRRWRRSARGSAAPGAALLASRIRQAYRALVAIGRRDGFTTTEFDTSGASAKPLPARRSIAGSPRAIARLNDVAGAAVTAEDCAVAANLSQSRFLHLFKDETGVSFRALPGLEAGAASAALRQCRHQPRASGAGHRLSGTRPISAIRSVASTACSRARSSPARAIWRSGAAIRNRASARNFGRGGCDADFARAARARKKRCAALRIIPLMTVCAAAIAAQHHRKG